jgi:hypothetical protein
MLDSNDLDVTMEIEITKRSSMTWKWRVYNLAGETLMSGRERTRPAARYQAYRAIFLLLATTRNRSNDPSQRFSRLG